MKKNKIPEGLLKCGKCGEYKGEATEDEEEGPLEVICICDGMLCPRCRRNKIRRPISNFFDEATNSVWHSPYFIGWALCSRCIDEDRMIREATNLVLLFRQNKIDQIRIEVCSNRSSIEEYKNENLIDKITDLDYQSEIVTGFVSEAQKLLLSQRNILFTEKMSLGFQYILLLTNQEGKEEYYEYVSQGISNKYCRILIKKITDESCKSSIKKRIDSSILIVFYTVIIYRQPLVKLFKKDPKNIIKFNKQFPGLLNDRKPIAFSYSVMVPPWDLLIFLTDKLHLERDKDYFDLEAPMFRRLRGPDGKWDQLSFERHFPRLKDKFKFVGESRGNVLIEPISSDSINQSEDDQFNFNQAIRKYKIKTRQ